VNDCAWTISFDNLGDKNELAPKARRLLDQADTVFRKHGIEVMYEGQQWIVDQIQKVNVKIAKDIAGFKVNDRGA
jgi:hypothetical protein